MRLARSFKGTLQPMRDRKIVVAGLIIRPSAQAGTHELLLTKRRSDQTLPDQWELPGGKVEAGEHPEDALARELREEIGVQANVGAIWDAVFHAYPAFDVLMLIYKCSLPPAADPRAIEVADMAWVGAKQIGSYDILAADIPLVRRIERDGIPMWEPSSRGADV